MAKERVRRGDGKLFITPQYIESTGLGSARRVMEMCADGTIKAIRFGRTWRIPRDEFNRQFGTNI